MWFDSHCHLQDEADPGAVVTAAREAGVTGMVCVGTDVASSLRAVELAGALGPGLWATVGLHPHHADRSGAQGVEGVAGLLASARTGGEGVGTSRPAAGWGPPPPGGGRGWGPGRGGAAASNIVAVGECGLDYHYDHSPRADQRRSFEAQVALASSSGLALVIHTREAWDDTFAVLASVGVPERTVFHCFTGGVEEARRCLDLGAWLSFSGIATFKGAPEVREAAALCPAERMLVETDAPFLAPVPHRGRPNQPAWVTLVGAALAGVRGVAPEELAASSRAGAIEAFALQVDTGAKPWVG